MKNIVTIISCTLIGAITLAIVMSVSGRMNRRMEVKSNLPSAVEETVENLSLKKYSIADIEEYLADFTATLSDFIDTDSELTVSVAGGGI